jgi:hypothetical protein
MLGINAVCQGTGAACNGTTMSIFGVDLASGIACEGGKLRTCVNGREHLVDCAARGLGFTCQTTGSGAFCGLASACTPPGADQPTCDPATKSLTVCNAGRIDHVACDQLGFVTCDVDRCVNALGGP